MAIGIRWVFQIVYSPLEGTDVLFNLDQLDFNVLTTTEKRPTRLF